MSKDAADSPQPPKLSANSPMESHPVLTPRAKEGRSQVSTRDRPRRDSDASVLALLPLTLRYQDCGAYCGGVSVLVGHHVGHSIRPAVPRSAPLGS